MKKVFCFLLTVATILLLAGCTGSKTAPTTIVETDPALVETTEVSETEPTVETTIATEAATVPTTVPQTEPEEIGETGVVYNTSYVNVRKAAGVNSELVTRLSSGTYVTVFEQITKDGAVWGRIEQGWVCMDYIKLEPKEDGPSGNTSSDHTHNYTSKVTKATCTSDGYTTYTCSCGDSYTGNYVPAAGHKWGAWVTTKEPTTTSTGTAQRICSVCSQKETKTLPVNIPNHTHKYTSKVTKQATCTTTGIRTYSCSCGDSYTETIAKTPHNYITKITKPTCTSKGYTTYTCSCGDSYTGNYVPAAGHKWGAWVTTKEPTTTSTGLKERKCQNCSEPQTEVIPKLTAPTEPTNPEGHTHTYGLATEIEPTCTTDGYYVRKCTTCGVEEKKPSYKPALGHRYGVISSTPADCTHNGSTTYKCSTCGDTYTDTTPATHNWVHHHEDAVTHTVVYVRCHCGWSAPYNGGAGIDAYTAHQNSVPPEELNNHSYYTSSETVVDVPAKDWDQCSLCGATK